MEDYLGMFEEEHYKELFRKYETMKKEGRVRFLDVDEFEELINGLLNHEDMDKATQAIDIALKQHPEASSLQLLHADILVRKNHMSEAGKILNYIKKIEPDNPEVSFLLGIVHLHKSRFSEAFSAFASAIRQDTQGDAEMALRCGRQLADYHCYPQAISCFEKALAFDSNDPEVIYEMWAAWDEMENLPLACQWTYNYLDVDPFSSEMWLLAAGYEYSRFNFDAALRAVDFAIAVKPDYYIFYERKARIMGKQRRMKEVIPWFRSLIPDVMDEYTAYYMMAVAYLESGDSRTALNKMPPLEKLDQSVRSQAHIYEARIYRNLGRHDIADGIYSAAIEAETTDLEILRNAYWYYKRNANPQMALLALDMLVKNDPFRIKFRRHFLRTVEEEASESTIHREYRAAVRMMPGVADFNYMYGVYLLRTGNTNAGYRYFSYGLVLDFARHKYFLKKNPELSTDVRLKALIVNHKNLNHEL